MISPLKNCLHPGATEFVCVRGWDENGRHNAAYVTVCPACREKYEASGDLLATPSEVVQWVG